MHTRFSHSSITLSGLLLLTINLICYACSSDNEDSALQEAVNQASAPDDPRSEFRFYKENADYWSFKVTPTDNPSCPLLVTSSTTTRVDNPYFDYTKNGDNTADVFCYFTTVAWNNYGSWQQYELTLTFLSPNHGIFEGVYKNTPTATGVPYKGVFVYDTDLEPEDFFSDENNESDIDWSCLTDFTWKATDISYKFNTDNTFSSTLSNGQSYNGKYNIDYTNNILNLTYSWETSPTAFRVLRLNEEELTMVNAELDDRYAETYISDDSPSGDEYDINISAPEITDITETSATIKGTILGDVEFNERGIVYGKSPNPTVNDNKVSINSNIINQTLNLETGAKYYVRLFARVDSEISYGPEVSFTMAGEQIKRFKANQTYWGDYDIELSIDVPAQVQSYGLCYSLNSSPKVTDNYLPERSSDTGLNHTDQWELTNLERGKVFHVRPYHIEGSKVQYSDEFTVSTLGVNIDIDVDFSYDTYLTERTGTFWGSIQGFKLTVNWSGLPTGTHKLSTRWKTYNSNNQFTPEPIYIDTSEGSKLYQQSEARLYDLVSSRTEMAWGGYAMISDLEGNIIARTLFTIKLGRYYSNYIEFLKYTPGQGWDW